MSAVQLPLFEPGALPDVATPAPEWSEEWREASLLRLVEALRFNPERLAAYQAKVPDGRDFLDFTILMLGGRSQ